MPSIDLRQINIDLLIVLDVLLRERNVSRAAEKLGRSQPATSQALARLRRTLGDPLLVNVNGKMQPTPHGEQIGNELGRMLDSLHRLLSDTTSFDPSTSARTFRVATPGLVGTFFPGLVQAVIRRAPGASVEMYPMGPSILDDMTKGLVEVLLGPMLPLAIDGLCARRLGALPWVVFARAGHPATRRWSLVEWARWPHVRVRMPTSDASPVDAAARLANVERRIGAVVSHMLEVPPLLSATDMLFTTVRGELPNHLDAFGLVALAPPIELQPLSFALYWSSHLAADPAAAWLRSTCIDVFKGVQRGCESLPVLPMAGDPPG